MRKCSYCADPTIGKLASSYWGWYPLEGDRIAYKIMYCKPHAEKHLMPIARTWNDNLPNEGEPVCWDCGAEVDSLRDKLFASIYMPNTDPIKLEVGLCSACLSKHQQDIAAVGQRLSNRTEIHARTGEDAWIAIGIVPVDS